MAARHAYHEHGRFRDDNEVLSANSSLSTAGGAIPESGTALDNILDFDRASFNLQDVRLDSPRTIPPLETSPSFSTSYQGVTFSPSTSHATYQLCSDHNPSRQYIANQTQHIGEVGHPNLSGPWNPLPAAGPPQRLPILVKPPGGESPFRTPTRGGDTWTLPLDSGYRSSSQYDTQSHRSTPINMGHYSQPILNQSEFPGLIPHYQDQEHVPDYEINYSPSQEPRQPQQQTERSGRKIPCSKCSHISKTASDDKKHQARHDKPWRCHHEECDQKGLGFATVNDFDRHRKSVHNEAVTGSKSYKCRAPGCQKHDKIWPRLDNFKSHIRRMHQGLNVEAVVERSGQEVDLAIDDGEEREETITNELHRQENSIRQAERRASVSTLTSTESKPKRRAQEPPDSPRESQRVRPTIQTFTSDPVQNAAPLQNMNFLSPHSPNIPRMYHNPLFGRNVTTNRPHRAHPQQRQRHAQRAESSGMIRSVSQQGPSSRRHTVGNAQQQQMMVQSWTSDHFNQESVQQLQYSPEDAQSAYEPQWTQQQQMAQAFAQDRHTIADVNYEWGECHNDIFFQDYTPASTAEIAPINDLVGQMHPAQASASPTITSNAPQTPVASTPVLMLAIDQDRPQAGTPEDINAFLHFHDGLKIVRQAIANNPAAQEELNLAVSRMYRVTRDSSSAAATTSESNQSSSQPQSQPQHQGRPQFHHQRQPSSSTTATSSTTGPDHTSTPSRALSHTSSATTPATATAAAIARTKAGKTNAVCTTCNREIGRDSDLKKHLKRHTRPYGCVWDGCYKRFGSKNDWKRHESTHGEFEGGWRCDGSHPNAGGAACQSWWPEALLGQVPGHGGHGEAACRAHLLTAGVAPGEVRDVMTRCHVPRADKGAFWCGICKAVVALGSDNEGKWAEARLGHIEQHYMRDQPQRTADEWVERAAGGRTKAEMEATLQPSRG